MVSKKKPGFGDPASRGLNSSSSLKKKKHDGKDIDIDELFTVLKEKKKDEATRRADDVRNEEEREKKRRKKDERNSSESSGKNNVIPGLILPTGSTTFIISPEAPLERIDKDSGLPVYKAHLLKVGEGGGTPLCPFDCACCF